MVTPDFTPLSAFDKSSLTTAGLTRIICVSAADTPPGPEQPLKKHFSSAAEMISKGTRHLGLNSHLQACLSPHPRPPTPGLSTCIQMTARRPH